MELVIASIMGLALLAIIVGLIGYFDNLTTQASLITFKNAIVSGANSPNGDIIEEKDLILDAQDYTTTTFSSWSKIPPECYTLDAADNESYSIVTGSSSSAIHIAKRSKVFIAIQCKLGSELSNSGFGDCQKSCLVSVGKAITS